MCSKWLALLASMAIFRSDRTYVTYVKMGPFSSLSMMLHADSLLLGHSRSNAIAELRLNICQL